MTEFHTDLQLHVLRSKNRSKQHSSDLSCLCVSSSVWLDENSNVRNEKKFTQKQNNTSINFTHKTLNAHIMANGDEAGQQGNNKSKRKCVTCLTAVLRDSKLGNYTTDKYNPLYRELFPGFDGVDGSICGSCYKRCYSERKKRYV